MSQISRTIVTAITVLAVLIGSTLIDRTGGAASATTIRPDKEQVRWSIEAAGLMADSCVAPGGSTPKNPRPTMC